MMTEQIALGSVLAFLSCSGYYKVNLNGKVSTLPTVRYVERKLCAYNTDHFQQCFPIYCAFRSGMNLYLCLCFQRVLQKCMSLVKEQPWNCTSVRWCCLHTVFILPFAVVQWEAGSFKAVEGV